MKRPIAASTLRYPSQLLSRSTASRHTSQPRHSIVKLAAFTTASRYQQNRLPSTPLIVKPLRHHQRATMSTTTSTPSFPPSEIQSILREVTQLLHSRSETLSIAETAAGGLLSSSLLSTPGASKFYKGGLTLYTLPSRIIYAGWSQATIEAYRGPTTDIVAGLAKHVRGDLESTYTLAESGTAGPTGGNTPNRRPGYVALAVDGPKGTFVREVNTGVSEGEGQRVGNMVQFAVEGLRLLRDVIEGREGLEKL